MQKHAYFVYNSYDGDSCDNDCIFMGNMRPYGNHYCKYYKCFLKREVTSPYTSNQVIKCFRCPACIEDSF